MGAPPLLLWGLKLAIMTLVACGAMQANWRSVIEAILKPVWLPRAVLAVNLAVPLAGLIMCLILPIDPMVKIAIMVMAASPLAPPISLKLVRAADNASSVEAHFALITLLAILFVPVTVALTSKLIGLEVSAPIQGVAQISVLLLILPMAIGVTIGTLLPALAERVAKPLAVGAYIVLFALALPILFMQAGSMLQLAGDGTIFAMVAITLVAAAAGHLLGGPKPEGRFLLASAAIVRHPGIALWVINSNGLDRRSVTAVFLFLVINLIVAAVYQRWAKGREAAAGTALAG
ncbi:hypothetical protein [Sphingomonas daechungensis]|uniref:hypothetical protein n=1 Tax=Sphingomonas daechungensis TaxID=1176646 RepID=UPI003782D536